MQNKLLSSVCNKINYSKINIFQQFFFFKLISFTATSASMAISILNNSVCLFDIL